MDSSSSVFVLLLTAVAFANAPFLTRRVFGFFGTEEKSLGARLGELVVAYFLVGGIGLLLLQAIRRATTVKHYEGPTELGKAWS